MKFVGMGNIFIGPTNCYSDPPSVTLKKVCACKSVPQSCPYFSSCILSSRYITSSLKTLPHFWLQASSAAGITILIKLYTDKNLLQIYFENMQAAMFLSVSLVKQSPSLSGAQGKVVSACQGELRYMNIRHVEEN